MILTSLAALRPALMKGRTAAVPGLIVALKSKDAERSSMARRLLAAVGSAAVRGLVKSMAPTTKDGVGVGLDPYCRSTTCQAIVFMGGRAAPTLLQMIKEADADVEGDPDSNRDPGLSRRMDDWGLIAGWALHAIGVKAVPYLLPWIGLETAPGYAARAALSGIGEAAVPGLIKALKQGKPNVRKSAAEFLATLGGGAVAVAALAAALTDPSRPVRHTAARGLARYDDGAAAALGNVRGSAAYEALRKMALGRNTKLAVQALTALGSFKTKAAKGLLKRRARSGNKRIAAAAKAALAGDLGGLKPTGVPWCDAYMRSMVCYLAKLPAAAQGPSKAAFMKLVAVWRKMALGPARASMAKSCQMMFQSWNAAVIKNPQFKSCFKP